MPFAHRPAGWRHARPWLSAVAVVALMLAALAGPVAAQGGSSTLRDAAVSPRLSRTSTTIHFGVTFRDRRDRPAVAVRVLIDGHPRAMRLGVAAEAERGVRYVAATRLIAGRHRIVFQAVDADGRRLSLDGGFAWIEAAASSTRGSATDADGSKAKPGADSGTSLGGHAAAKPGIDWGGSSGPGAKDPAPSRDQGTDAGQGGSSGNGADAAPTPPPDSTAGDGDLGPTAAPFEGRPIGPGLAADTGDTNAPVATLPDASPGPVAGLGASAADRGGSDGSSPSGTRDGSGSDPGGQAAPRGLEAIGLGGGLFDQVFRAYPVLITTGGTTVVWAAFVIFGKRRRDGEPPAPEAVLAAHAAAGVGPIQVADLIPAVQPRQLPPGVEPDEADLPRWRRPSLLQARKTDPLRTASVAMSLSFAAAAGGALGMVDGGERRLIRYRLVRLLDVPDEVSGRELGILDAGDEVQIVETYGIYRLVVCPDGLRGWLHKMVLGELVEQDPADDDIPDGIDEGVLAAFLGARRQTA